MLARNRLLLAAASLLALGGAALAPSPAEARVGVFVGGYFGFPGYYYPPAYYYPYGYSYSYYYPPYYAYPPAYSYPAPPPSAPPAPPAPASYSSNVPPPPTAAAPEEAPTPLAGAPGNGQKCHDFQTSEQGGTGTHTACQQPDGTWKIVR